MGKKLKFGDEGVLLGVRSQRIHPTEPSAPLYNWVGRNLPGRFSGASRCNMLQTVVTYAPTLFGCFLFVVCCGVGCVCVCVMARTREGQEKRKGRVRAGSGAQKRKEGGEEECARVCAKKIRNFQEHLRILEKKEQKEEESGTRKKITPQDRLSRMKNNCRETKLP